MCYISHYNESSNWYHFYTATDPETSFSFARYLIDNDNGLLHAANQTSIRRCFSLSTSFTGSGIHATVHNPKCFSCVVWCTVALFLAENKVVNIADIRCCTIYLCRK